MVYNQIGMVWNETQQGAKSDLDITSVIEFEFKVNL